MAKFPPVAHQFETEKFAAYLAENGVQILKPTSEWELLRYRREDFGVIIIHKNARGQTSASELAKQHYAFFRSARALDKVKRPAGNFREQLVEELLKRDGDCCCFCGQALNGDITLEHFLNVSDGGNNKLANTALAHDACNSLAGNLSIIEKMALRDRLRNCVALVADLDVVIEPKRLCTLVAEARP